QPARSRAGRERRPDAGRAEVRPVPRGETLLVRRVVDPRLHPALPDGQLAHGEARDHASAAQAVLQPAEGAGEADEAGVRGRAQAARGAARRHRARRAGQVRCHARARAAAGGAPNRPPARASPARVARLRRAVGQAAGGLMDLPLSLRDHPLRRPRILLPVVALLALVHLPFLHALLRGPAEVRAAVPFRDDFDRATLGDAYWSNGGHWRIARGQVYSPGVGNNHLWLKARLPRDVRIEFDARSA